VDWLLVIAQMCQASGGPNAYLVKVVQQDCQRQLIECVLKEKGDFIIPKDVSVCVLKRAKGALK
jgi:hypothetical protein